MLAHWEVGLVMAGLNNSVPVPHKPLLSSLASLPRALRLVWLSSVPLPTSPNVEDVSGGAGDVPLDGHVLPCAADPHSLDFTHTCLPSYSFFLAPSRLSFLRINLNFFLSII